jgi:CheY-like chemotaxis protein
MNSIEACRALRQHESHPSHPRHLITTRGEEEYVAGLRRLLNDYVSSP